ncbi:oligopeptide transport system ATP-binding protein [Desulfonispora thiosulfatigenes DSM 11270]|uniref:Oligopeptide transport system ATP-binding protein n=1 Tax=Desulfonispora thiosulfatigenes DSM 11270 TaxID=656914 RepID=A0A1W1V8D2_DESTI|nr:ATP-binding cassette domain-containing protein [Desulfonispora thiosulfatigenes]SMB89689.1 oligopeptide transport system ATP-binding protein [Desulfonispora thiosulfatigenes DSM 11270]
MIKICTLKKYYQGKGSFLKESTPIKALDGIDLEINEGENLGIIGESGSGKSTLSRLLVSIEKPSEGKIYFENIDINKCSKKQFKEFTKNVQLVFQNPYDSLNPRMNVRNILKEPLDNHFKISQEEKNEKIKQILKDVGLNEKFISSYPHELSGGQRQRIALARALILKPKYIILDEPLASLDVSFQAQILNLLVDLKEKFKITYIFISHDLNAVRYLCEKVAVIYEGKIMEVIPADKLEESTHPYTKLLLSYIPFFKPNDKLKDKGLSSKRLSLGCKDIRKLANQF